MTYPYAIVSDLHFHNWSQFSLVGTNGVNSRLQIILDELLRAAEILRTHGGKYMYIAGDVFHVRGSLTPSVLNPVESTIAAICNSGIRVRIIPGNHDMEFKTSAWSGNAVSVLSSAGAQVMTYDVGYREPETVMIPWMPDLNDLIGVAKKRLNSDADLIIHAPMNNVIKGIPDLGLHPSDLAELGYKRVFVGHYHNYKYMGDGVYSIGATTHQTWGDVDSEAGFLIVDENDVNHFPSHAPSFVDFDHSLGKDKIKSYCEGNYIRVKMEDQSESEIVNLRKELIACGAKGQIFQTTPKASTVGRTHSISSGSSLQQSIKEWVDEHILENEEEVYLECEEILREIP